MQYTMHLTEACNLACKYCTLQQSSRVMTQETAFKTAELILKDNHPNIGLGFYGGEPLLCKELIYDVIDYIKEKAAGTNKNIYYKITTNGLLLDEAFISYAGREGILIALSMDGHEKAHDRNRVDHKGKGTYARLKEIVPMLLTENRYTPVMMTVTPNNVTYFADSVSHVYSMGFIYLICSLDYGADWNKTSLNELRRQYEKLSKFYYINTMNESKFYLSPFESKINSHIQHKEYCIDRCLLGYEQISISVDGILYPCIQFTGDPGYSIGDVYTGINQMRRKEIFKESRGEQPECRQCAVKKRCLHTCACLNKHTTGRLNAPSPILCAHERMLIPVADRLAGKLYKKRNGMFIQKHYNEYYSLVSLAEDRYEKV